MLFILLFNVMEVLGMGGGAMLYIPCMVAHVIPVCICMFLPYSLFVSVYVGSYLLI